MLSVAERRVLLGSGVGAEDGCVPGKEEQTDTHHAAEPTYRSPRSGLGDRTEARGSGSTELGAASPSQGSPTPWTPTPLGAGSIPKVSRSPPAASCSRRLGPW